MKAGVSNDALVGRWGLDNAKTSFPACKEDGLKMWISKRHKTLEPEVDRPLTGCKFLASETSPPMNQIYYPNALAMFLIHQLSLPSFTAKHTYPLLHNSTAQTRFPSSQVQSQYHNHVGRSVSTSYKYFLVRPNTAPPVRGSGSCVTPQHLQ